ncbi:MAG: chromosomal replication initiator protein DnaA [Verrucomicrobiae bacterium]|nr:chromosomal replication initiator protein DnaA [Verrucomicrobiae bacterium]
MTKSADGVWRDTCKLLQEMLNPEMYKRWFAPVQPVEFTNDTLVLGVANEFQQFWLEDNFSSLIRDAAQQQLKRPIQLRFVVTATGHAKKESPTPPAEVAPPSQPATRTDELKLNPRYTFDSFVVGPNNSFAHAAALAVAQSPAKAYNPLFIYGGVGLGKTHLMQAIGHQVIQQRRGLRVCYVTCEQFTNEFIQAIQTNSLTRFRRKFRHNDLLLIDDIQFLAGKERMQEEFFHTFNSLFDAHKQIVLSSDRPATEIANLEARLVSRFEWGLVTELQPPALETRIAIVRKKAAGFSVSIPDDVLVFLAEKIRTNIRRLEGALVRVASFASLNGGNLNLLQVESLLRDVLQEEARRSVSIEMIQKTVAEHFDIRLADMTSHRRPKAVAFPRQVAMYLSRKLTDRSLADIGEAFGGRDHGTVLHACRLVEKRLQQDPTLRHTISYLESALQRQ